MQKSEVNIWYVQYSYHMYHEKQPELPCYLTSSTTAFVFKNASGDSKGATAPRYLLSVSSSGGISSLGRRDWYLNVPPSPSSSSSLLSSSFFLLLCAFPPPLTEERRPLDEEVVATPLGAREVLLLLLLLLLAWTGGVPFWALLLVCPSSGAPPSLLLPLPRLLSGTSVPFIVVKRQPPSFLAIAAGAVDFVVVVVVAASWEARSWRVSSDGGVLLTMGLARVACCFCSSPCHLWLLLEINLLMIL